LVWLLAPTGLLGALCQDGMVMVTTLDGQKALLSNLL